MVTLGPVEIGLGGGVDLACDVAFETPRSEAGAETLVTLATLATALHGMRAQSVGSHGLGAHRWTVGGPVPRSAPVTMSLTGDESGR